MKIEISNGGTNLRKLVGHQENYNSYSTALIEHLLQRIRVKNLFSGCNYHVFDNYTDPYTEVDENSIVFILGFESDKMSRNLGAIALVKQSGGYEDFGNIISFPFGVNGGTPILPHPTPILERKYIIGTALGFTNDTRYNLFKAVNDKFKVYSNIYDTLLEVRKDFDKEGGSEGYGLPPRLKLERQGHRLIFNIDSYKGSSTSTKVRDSYGKLLNNSQFFVSCPGNVVDCHRTYEALAAGCIPISNEWPKYHIYDEHPFVTVQEDYTDMLDIVNSMSDKEKVERAEACKEWYTKYITDLDFQCDRIEKYITNKLTIKHELSRSLREESWL